MRLGKALATGVAEERPRQTRETDETGEGLRLGEEGVEFEAAEVADVTEEPEPAAEEVPVVR